MRSKESLMNKVFLIIGTSLTAVLLLFAVPASAQGNSAELQKVRDTVSERFAEIDPQEIFESPIEGWYTIRKGAIIAYISADGRYLLQGDMIDLQDNSNLTEQARNDARVVMLSAVPDEDLIIFSPDKVQHSVSIFTDIDCTFCRRLHAQIDDYMDQGIEIRYFLYPRNGPTSPSWAKAENVWCADDRNEALTLAKLDKEYPTHTCDSSIVSNHYLIGQDVGLRGTPAIVLVDGTLFSGYLPPAQLKEAIVAAGQ
jgi:thiol:disulfide interchange protein DsbC